MDRSLFFPYRAPAAALGAGVLFALAFLGYIPASQASVIVAEYGFFVSDSAGVSNQTPSPTGDADPATTASSAVWGSVNSGSFAHSAEIQNKARVATNSTSTDNTLATAINENRYLGFTLTNNSGGLLTLDQLTFNHEFINAHPSINASIAVLAKVGGGSFTAADQVGSTIFVDFPDATVSGNEDYDYGLRVIDMSAFTLSDAASIEVRLYFFDSSTASTRFHVVDNLTLTAVPEPGAAAMGLLGVLYLGAFARRRRVVCG